MESGRMGQVRDGSATYRCPAVVCLQTMRGDARRQSSNRAIASFDRGTEQAAWDQPEDGCKVAEAADRRGSQDRAEGASLNRSKRRIGGDRRCVSPPHAAASR